MRHYPTLIATLISACAGDSFAPAPNQEPRPPEPASEAVFEPTATATTPSAPKTPSETILTRGPVPSRPHASGVERDAGPRVTFADAAIDAEPEPAMTPQCQHGPNYDGRICPDQPAVGWAQCLEPPGPSCKQTVFGWWCCPL